MLLTVTLNPALDRTMTVPNFQAGMRHRATDTVILPGGKGINAPRAGKTLGRPVIATGFVGGRKGDQIVADLNGEGILCDFVRVAGDSRISTAVVDSATNGITEINEQGPEIQPEELEALFDKLDYLGRAAEIVILAGSVPLVANPIRLSASPLEYASAPPLLGQHTNEILHELLGLPQAELARLRDQGVIGPSA